MQIPTALAYSCNCFVAYFARRAAAGLLPQALSRAGFQTNPAPSELQALGEAGVLVSAIDMANAYRTLATNPPPSILEGLEGAVEFGTARLAAIRKDSAPKVAGKTGTGRTHAWFAGFAPSRAPKFVIAVLTAGHSGGADAAPIASKVLGEML